MSELPEQAAEPTHAGAHGGSHAAPHASHVAAHHADDRSRGAVPWRFAIAVLSAYVVVGALAGVVWEWVWTPPAQFVQQHQLYYVDYAALRRVFDGTGLYVLIAAIASALVALVVCVLTRRRELLTLGLVILGSVLAAVVMRAGRLRPRTARPGDRGGARRRRNPSARPPPGRRRHPAPGLADDLAVHGGPHLLRLARPLPGSPPGDQAGTGRSEHRAELPSTTW